MITMEYLGQRFGSNVQILESQAAGLSHADSLLQMPFRANCLNWVLGHLIISRLTIMRLLDLEEKYPISRDELAKYGRDSEPITEDGEGVLPMERLFELLNTTQAHIAARLLELNDDDLTTPDEKGTTLGQRLLFYYFHDTYHTGQTEFHRQLAGMDDKII